MRFAHTLRSLILGIWLGGVLCAAIIVAPTLFTKLESRTLAGDLFGEILRRLNVFELVCFGLLIGIRILILFWKNETPKTVNGLRSPNNKDSVSVRKLLPSDVILLLIVCNWFYYAKIITPEMTELKKVITTFDLPVNVQPKGVLQKDMQPNAMLSAESERDPTKLQEVSARKRFDSLHHRYSKAMSGNLILGVILFLSLNLRIHATNKNAIESAVGRKIP